jgi:hypothetical protein
MVVHLFVRRICFETRWALESSIIPASNGDSYRGMLNESEAAVQRMKLQTMINCISDIYAADVAVAVARRHLLQAAHLWGERRRECRVFWR